MKLKKYFKKIATENSVSNLKAEIARDFGSIYAKPKEKLYSYVRAKPVKSFIIMIGIIVVNFSIVYYFDTRSPAKTSFTTINEFIKKAPIIQSNSEIPLSFENISNIKEIKDSLEMFSVKSSYTHTDSLALRKLLKRYLAIDPAAFKKIKK